MRVKASALETQSFHIERRGYQKDEVNAVLAEVTTTLREYEEEISRLEDRVAHAEEVEEAIRRTFLAAQRTKEEMVAEAREESERLRTEAEQIFAEARAGAQSLLEDALAEAERIGREGRQEVEAARQESNRLLTDARSESERLIAESEALADGTKEKSRSEAQQRILAAQKESDRLLTDAQEQGEAFRSQARSEAEERLAAASRDADLLMTDAQANAEATVREAATSAERTVGAATDEADRIEAETAAQVRQQLVEANAQRESALTKAADAARKIRSDAQAEAEELLREAREELDLLSRRVPRLRTAVGDVQQRLKQLAASTLVDLEVVDAMIDLAAQEAEPQEMGQEDEAVTTAGQGKEAWLPDGSGAPPAARPAIATEKEHSFAKEDRVATGRAEPAPQAGEAQDERSKQAMRSPQESSADLSREMAGPSKNAGKASIGEQGESKSGQEDATDADHTQPIEATEEATDAWDDDIPATPEDDRWRSPESETRYQRKGKGLRERLANLKNERARGS